VGAADPAIDRIAGRVILLAGEHLSPEIGHFHLALEIDGALFVGPIGPEGGSSQAFDQGRGGIGQAIEPVP
jgi:hypothetical protein